MSITKSQFVKEVCDACGAEFEIERFWLAGTVLCDPCEETYRDSQDDDSFESALWAKAGLR